MYVVFNEQYFTVEIQTEPMDYAPGRRPEETV
jgi:hypothetical protein